MPNLRGGFGGGGLSQHRCFIFLILLMGHVLYQPHAFQFAIVVATACTSYSPTLCFPSAPNIPEVAALLTVGDEEEVTFADSCFRVSSSVIHPWVQACTQVTPITDPGYLAERVLTWGLLAMSDPQIGLTCAVFKTTLNKPTFKFQKPAHKNQLLQKQNETQRPVALENCSRSNNTTC